jgi:hypothetical protein
MLLAYGENPSFFLVGRQLGVHHQTVQRCVERALAYGVLGALDVEASLEQLIEPTNGIAGPPTATTPTSTRPIAERAFTPA